MAFCNDIFVCERTDKITWYCRGGWWESIGGFVMVCILRAPLLADFQEDRSERY